MIWGESPKIPGRESFAVRDNTGDSPVDREYIELGKQEGWLTYVGMFRDYKDSLIHVYRHF